MTPSRSWLDEELRATSIANPTPTMPPTTHLSVPPERNATGPGRVLLVGDEDSGGVPLASALRRAGFDVVTTVLGNAAHDTALDVARRTRPEVVVLDVNRANSGGADFCASLRSLTPSRISVLHLSSSTSSDERARALDAGADACVAYPTGDNELRAIVSALVRLKGGASTGAVVAPEGSLLHDTLDALADHVALLGPDGSVVAVNRAWAEFASENGYLAGGTGLGTNYLEVCEQATGDNAAEAHAAAVGIRRVLGGEVSEFELDYPCHSVAAERWFHLAARRVARGGTIAAIVTHTDLTRQQLAARAESIALDEAESDRRRLMTTLQAIPVGVWITDASGRVTHTNPAAARLWGGDAPHPEGPDEYRVYRAWWPDTGVPVEPDEWALARTIVTGETITGQIAEIERFDGTRGFILSSSAPIRDGEGRLAGAVVACVDVSDHQRALKERELLVASLEQERSHLADIFDKAPAFLAVMRGAEYIFERVNPAYQRLVGHRPSVGLPLLEALPELRGQGFVEILDRVRETGEPFVSQHIPVRLARVPGAPLETRYVDQVYQRLADAEGELAIITHGVDVTEQVLATEGLRLSEQRLRDQFAKLPVPTYLWELRDDELILLDSNDAAIRSNPRFGPEGVGRTWTQFFPSSPDVAADLRRSVRENVVIRRSQQFDAGAPRGLRHLDLTIGPQPPDRVLVHVVDTTDQMVLEAQLRQAMKMEAVGRLAGGVAHDFNNLLTVIGAHSAFLLETFDDNDPRYEDAEAIQKAGVRAAALTRQLLAFSRKQILKPTILDLNEIVAETRKLLGRLLGENIEIVTDLASDLGRVVGDASQIDQVLMNLAVNARDAMPDGGRLDISTRNVDVSGELAGARRVIPAGAYVVLEVRDTGAGMDATVQGRMFEPFFTTKGPGKGTGLGLATVYGIVKQSAGYIIVESAVGHGTTFQVYLPIVSAEEEDVGLRAAESLVARGVETVLIVEDEPAVREIAKRVLLREGYVVLEAGNGPDALAIAEAFQSTIHLVVSDAVMPGMGGPEVVRRLREARPTLKSLYMSGYTDDEIVRMGIVSSSVPFIQKPFELVEFAKAVRGALDE